MVLLPLTNLFRAIESALSAVKRFDRPQRETIRERDLDALSRLGGGRAETLLYLYAQMMRRL